MPRHATLVIEINDDKAFQRSFETFKASLSEEGAKNALVASSIEHEILKIEMIEELLLEHDCEIRPVIEDILNSQNIAEKTLDDFLDGD